MKLDPATVSQNRAAAPDTSTWLSANAGSGKTRVLTDRVARLLLEGTNPQNILCLTYTKAAASEMQNRLFQRLGDWAMKSDGELAEDLQKMGVTGVGDSKHLSQARRLFARAIETPGGLRIQTIHSFCASLLRRFPLEAGVSPAFTEMDDHAAKLLRAEVVEDMAGGGDVDAFDAVAAYYSGEDLDELTRAVVSHAASLVQKVDRATVLHWFDVPQDRTLDSLLSEVFLGGETALIRRITPVLEESDKSTDNKAARRLRNMTFDAPGPETLRELISLFLTGTGAKEPFSAKIGSFPTKNTRDRLGVLCEDLEDLMARVETACAQFFALMAAEKTVALYQFGSAFLPAYDTRKRIRGALDFDDLISKTRDLLSDRSVADWVLYRLDGGLDHILVDEAQDTSPIQWQVIERLAQEFAVGLGARENTTRTIFVVGDKKQSIYSFQGADPEGFDRMRDEFRMRLENASQPFQQKLLEYSFRSSKAILDVVDSVFGMMPADRLTMDLQHNAFHGLLPGRVDLWPVVPKATKPDRKHWYEPLDITADNNHDIILARKIAAHIADTIGTETIPLSNGTRRTVRAGDYLILVQRRSALFAEIIRSCKALGLPVAGADRLKLGGELAVKDVAAVLSFLATPEDDLSLAAALRSPLFGWSEGDLYDLAANRTELYLWTALRGAAAKHPETIAILNDLRDQADYLRPYDLIERLLARHDGRRRLLARLGQEAEDGIDSLLSQALAYEQRDVPSLTGFLGWLETDDIEVKRQLDNAGDQIRVMTVHGAKGLESPIVILPDTARRTRPNRDEILTLDNGATVWKTRAGEQPAAMRNAFERNKAAQLSEDLRLLYVAMTRAETWLIVAAAGDVGTGEDSWHAMVRRGLEALDAHTLETPVGPGLRSFHLDWNAGELNEATPRNEPCPTLPDWLDVPVSMPPDLEALSPSDLGGAKVLAEEAVDGESEDAKQRGRQVHLLLEHLPNVTGDKHAQTARALLSAGPDPLDDLQFEPLFEEAQRVLSDPGLYWLFASDVLSEVDVTANLPELGDKRIHGTIDKLLVSPDRVLAVDFKTNRVIPGSAAETPLGLLRQMGAYQQALSQVFGGRTIETAILWTFEPRLMMLPHDIVRAALQSKPTS